MARGKSRQPVSPSEAKPNRASSAVEGGASLGLYLHIPFCSAICNYCNFNRGLFDAAMKARYVRALEAEILAAGDGTAADSVFFGPDTYRFCALLDDMRHRTDTRFVVVTHNPITMAKMDRLYGVTMAERGVSQVVSVDLAQAERYREAS